MEQQVETEILPTTEGLENKFTARKSLRRTSTSWATSLIVFGLRDKKEAEGDKKRKEKRRRRRWENYFTIHISMIPIPHYDPVVLCEYTSQYVQTTTDFPFLLHFFFLNVPISLLW